MVGEAIQQFKDYYETDKEETPFFEFLDNLPNIDKLRFMELFEDYTVDRTDKKDFISVPKREHNPELSLFSNLVLDMADFKDRIKPMAKDMALMDAQRYYQKHSVARLEQEAEKFHQQMEQLKDKFEREEIEQPRSRELHDK